MFNSVALDVVIGLVFIYLLYSLLVSIIQEMIATNLGFRAKVLEKSIIRMLEDEAIPKPGGNKLLQSIKPIIDRIGSYFNMFFGGNRLKNKTLASAFYNHPLIKYMAEDKYHSKPSYISSENFSKVMIDLLHGVYQGSSTLDLKRIEDTLNEGKLIYNNMLTSQYQTATNGFTDINEDTRLMLISLLQEAEGDLAVYKNKLEQWFNDTQGRASSWYKKYTQVILFAIGLSLAIGFNVDTISIVKKLSKDPKLREEMVQSAIAYSEKNSEITGRLQSMKNSNPSVDTTTEYKNLKALADTLYHKNMALINEADSLVQHDIHAVNHLLGMGWKAGRDDCDFLSPIGWLLTAIALSMGAPFWFDMLNKLIKIRGSQKETTASNTEPKTGASNNVSGQNNSPVQVTINNRQTEEEAVG